MSRYDKQETIINNSDLYDNIFREKNVTSIKQKSTNNFSKIINDFYRFNFIIHTWNKTDKIYNISNRYYGKPDYYWAILYMNKYSSQFEIKEGDSIFIYYPITSIIK